VVGASRACAGSARGKFAHATAWGTLHNSGIDAAENTARFRAQNVHTGDRQVITSDGDIEIVFQGKPDSVFLAINRASHRESSDSGHGNWLVAALEPCWANTRSGDYVSSAH